MLDKFRSHKIIWNKATNKIVTEFRVSSSDEKGRKMVVQIINGQHIEDLTDASLSLYWETKNKKNYGLDVFDVIDAKQGIFEIYFTTGMLSNIGELNANLYLVDSTGSVTSEPFRIHVFKGINNDAIQSENSFSTLVDALNRVVTIEANEQARQDTFEANEVTRQNSYESSEASRNTTFRSEENKRQADFVVSETRRRDDFEYNESVRQQEFNVAEGNRQSNETTRIASELNRIAAEDTRKSNETKRINLYNDIESKLQSGYFKGEKGDQGDVSLEQIQGMIKYPWNISDSDDLNDYLTSGVYNRASAINVNTITNRPSGTLHPFVLIVSATNVNRVNQLYLDKRGRVYSRSSFDSEGWTEWEKLVTQSDLDDMLSEYDQAELNNKFHNIFNGTTRYFAHRGLSGYYPENTLTAFKKAAKHDFYGIELDVYYTSDNKWVVHHDSTLTRMTNSTGTISNMTFAQVTGTTVTKGNGQAFVSDEKVPSFESVLKLARQTNVVMQIEVKSSDNRNLSGLVDLVKKYNMMDRVLFISFQLAHLEEIRRISKEAMLAYVVSTYSTTALNNAKRLGRCAISAGYSSVQNNLENVVKEAHDNGVPIGCWTVNDIVVADKLASLGYDFVTTDTIPGNNEKEGLRSYTFKGSRDAGFRLMGTNADNTGDNERFVTDDAIIEAAPTTTTDFLITHAVPFLPDIEGRTLRGVAQAGVGGSMARYDIMTSTEQPGHFRVKFIDRNTGSLLNRDSIPTSTTWFNVQVRGLDRGQ